MPDYIISIFVWHLYHTPVNIINPPIIILTISINVLALGKFKKITSQYESIFPKYFIQYF
ncbi:hypothetical protein psyc5s11_09710 [Clostridium gelidum]|uniref:Uncharacterized protein n=1 Tax=Clostridium gelidum TaxID=704125 RepID=A0ABM7T202_9CLOT|nr:hypothetical protein psyc5s11_09710 [Clostridium gelidum]